MPTILFFLGLMLPLVSTGGLPGQSSELFTLREHSSQRASSSDPAWETGNDDWSPVEPGETLEIANLQGPGVIRHMWFTVSARDFFYPASLVLRIYWDGAEQPAVEAPFGDFFAVGHGLKRQFDSEMVSISAEGRSYNCYWPMPFRESARITITNESNLGVRRFYHYVNYDQGVELGPDTAHFYAQYRQAFPPQEEDRYIVLETEGRGHYAGTVLSVTNRQFSWFGEGDDFFFIDGSDAPVIRGTGTEDYFNDAWGFREFTHRHHGVTVYEGGATGDRTTAYKWHTQFPIVFQTSLRFELEHTGIRQYSNGTSDGYGPRPDDWSSVAFWYQAEPPANWPAFPTLEQRFHYPIQVSATTLMKSMKNQNAELIVDSPLGEHVKINAKSAGTSTTLSVIAPSSGRYRVSIIVAQNRDSGIFRMQAGERMRDEVNLFAYHSRLEEITLGVFQLQENEILPISFETIGTDYRSEVNESGQPGYNLGLRSVLLYPLESRFYESQVIEEVDSILIK